MASLEDLFYQIFNRKNWIIDQLKQQQHSYDQSLTSSLLINQICPPSWLLKNNTNHRELKNEELISDLLFRPQKTTVTSSVGCCPLYGRLLVKGDKDQLSDSFFTETCASNRYLDSENRLPEVTKSYLSESEVGQKISVKEVAATDSLTAIHQVQKETEDVDGCFELNQSLARIQRSRSRQKGIELRNSEKLKRKSRSGTVEITNEFTGRITRSRTSFQQSRCLMELPKTMVHGEGDKEAQLMSETNTTSKLSGSIAGIISTPQNPRRVDESSEMVESSNQRDWKCPHEPAGILATEIISNALDIAKFSDCSLIPNFVDPKLGLSLAVNSRHLNSCSIVQKSQSQPSGRKTSRRRQLGPTKADDDNIFEPKQLVFDDIEECDKLKPTQSSEREDIVEDFQMKDDGSGGNREKEQRQSIESVDSEFLKDGKISEFFSSEALEGSAIKVHGEEGLDLVETEKVSCLSNNVTTEIFKELVDDTPPTSKEISNQKLASVNILSGLRGLSYKIDMGKQNSETAVSILEVNVDPKIPDEKSVGNRDLGSTICESCGEANVVLGDFQLASIAIGTCLNSTSTKPNDDSSFPFSEKLDLLLEAQATEVPEFTSDAAGKSVLKEVLTPEADHICSSGREAPYFLRSRSTDNDKNVNSAKSSVYNNTGNSNQLAKISPKFAAICSKERKAPYILRSHSTGHEKNVNSVNSNGSHDMRKFRESMIANLSFSGSSKSIRDACEASWPPFKRRKINNQPDLALATLLKIRRVKPVLQSHDDDVSKPTEELHNFVPIEVGDRQLNAVAEHPEVEMDQSIVHRNKAEFESSPKLQFLCSPLSAKEGNCDSKREDQASMTKGLFKQEWMESSNDYGSKKQVGGSTECCFRSDDEESTSFLLDVGRWSNSEIGLNTNYFRSNLELETVFVPSDKIEDSAEGCTAEKKSQHGEKSSYYTVKLPNHEGLDYGNRNLCMLSPDDTMPEFEGFSIGASNKTTEPFLVGNGLIFENSDLPSITETRHSAVEQCSIPTPLPCSSTKYRIHTTPDVYQLLPNGLLEHIGLKNSLPCSADGSKKLAANKSLNFTDVYCNLGAQINGSLLESFKSDSIPSSVRFRWDIKRPSNYTPPCGKFSERTILKSSSSSSDKQLSRIPELTCFQIEEDTSTYEENIHLDEKLKSPQKGIGSDEKRISTNHDALVDATSLYSNPPISTTEAGMFPERSSVNSVNAQTNLFGIQIGTNQKIENRYGHCRRYTTEDKVNHNFSLVGAQKANGSLRRGLLTPKLSSNAVKRNRSQTFLEKGGKPNNIVSNVPSFLPFVQQKQQAPTVLTGKRDIKVKALEAAEAAKRLEEKKENERKMRKEAAKIERAKIEAKNLRQLEMKQKQKEEERKKKEAEMATKKRQREEEEKEKEKKRKCLEETRRQQHKEHKDRLRAEKEEKEQLRKALEEKERMKKESAEEAKKQERTEKAKEVDGCRVRTEMETIDTRLSIADSIKVSSIHENCGALEKPGDFGKVSNNIHSLGMASKKSISIIGGSEEPESYEITPYKVSDDEEEDDDLTPKKILPPWARKENLIPDLLLQQKIDPDEMFLRIKCFSLNEVLGTWKQRPGERRI